jgi:hypothetical protein
MNKTFASSVECCEAIARWLADEVPEPWEKITVNFEVIELDDVSEEIIHYAPKRNPEKLRQFFIDDTRFAECFFALAHLTSTPETGFFKKAKFTLYHDGRYTTDFEH